MEMMEAIQARHAVRAYTGAPIEGEALAQLQAAVEAANHEGGLRIQLCTKEPGALSGMMTGAFKNADNYLALVGKKGPQLEEKCGYYGEKIVLRARQLGLASCWVGMYSRGKSRAIVGPGEKRVIVVALGYGQTQGVPRKTKSVEELSQAGPLPEWFRRGVEAAQLAPTAMNQQKFRFELADGRVRATPGSGFYTKVDLGIAKCHFEIGAGEGDWRWA